MFMMNMAMTAENLKRNSPDDEVTVANGLGSRILQTEC